ncbi:MAG: protein kinase [Anaerolineae bacterium]|nr:protein kinase [Anaerolineae bacterium]
MTQRIINPFVFGQPVPPSHFIGREMVINNAYNRLAGQVHTSIAISGEHGIGKTSLLHHLIHVANDEEWGQNFGYNLFCFLDCQAIDPFTPTNFWYRVLEGIKQTNYSFSQHEEIDRLLAKPEIVATDIQRLLVWMYQQGVVVVLVLDSFASILNKASTDIPESAIVHFLSGLRALANHPEHALTMIIATREPLHFLLGDLVKKYPGSQFYNNFAFESLGPFTDDEIASWLQQSLADVDFRFEQAQQDFLHHIAGHHPALLQMAAYHLFEARRKGPLEPKTYGDIVESFKQSARHYFKLFWSEASPHEQVVLILILMRPFVDPVAHPIHSDEIDQHLDRLERDLNRLIERGLVCRTADSFRVFSSVFDRWIINEVRTENETEFVKRQVAISSETLHRAWKTLDTLLPKLTFDNTTHSLAWRVERPTSTPTDAASSPKPSRERDPSSVPVVMLEERFEIQQELGRGASSIVYKAWDTKMRRTVALKLLHSTLFASEADGYELLLKEARAASQLKHQSIVTIYDITSVKDQICLVMEYLEGRTLADLIRQKQRLSWRQAIALVEQAAVTLDYAHSQGVLHRDIKPANLVIATTGRLIVTDFGIAKLLNEPQASQSTGLRGTVMYMSPEQVNQQKLDGRSDLFSLATVAFEMLSGSLPWPGTSQFEIMKYIAAEPPRSLSEFKTPDADKLDPVFQKALTKDPDQRYQQGLEFVQALKSAVTS